MSAVAASSLPPARRPAVSTRLIVTVWAVIASLWIILDQATKALAVSQLEAQNRVVDLGFILLRTIRNEGGAFGFPGLPGLFVVVSALVMTLVIRALPKTERVSVAVAYGLVTGGALGNLVDRLFRDPGFPSGAVVDFFDLTWWPVFNIADIGIVSGAILIALLMIQADRQDRAAAAGGPPAQSIRPDTAHPRR